MNSSLIACAHTHTGNLHWHSRQLIGMQMRGEVNANRSKGNEQGAAQEEERTSFSFTASTAALGRDGSIHTERFCCWLVRRDCDGFSTDPG